MGSDDVLFDPSKQSSADVWATKGSPDPADGEQVMNGIFGSSAPSASELEQELERVRSAPKLERNQEGIVIAQRFHLSPTGLQFDESVTREEWEAFADVINQFETSLQWIIADWLIYGDGKGYFTWEQVGDEFFAGRYSSETLRKYARVARAMVNGIRIPSLSFGHHQTVVECAEDDEQYEHWLALAEEKSWPVSRLRKEMRDEQAPSKTPAWQKKKDALVGYLSKNRWQSMGISAKREVYNDLLHKLRELEEWGIDD